MAEEQGFAQARARLEEIVGQVRKKDTSLEQSLDLLEEGVRLANQCTELVDHSEWRPSGEPAVEGDGEGDTVTEGIVSEVATHDEVSSEASAALALRASPARFNFSARAWASASRCASSPLSRASTSAAARLSSSARSAASCRARSSISAS